MDYDLRPPLYPGGGTHALARGGTQTSLAHNSCWNIWRSRGLPEMIRGVMLGFTLEPGAVRFPRLVLALLAYVTINSAMRL
jgi:hypothetical protein